MICIEYALKYVMFMIFFIIIIMTICTNCVMWGHIMYYYLIIIIIIIIIVQQYCNLGQIEYYNNTVHVYIHTLYIISIAIIIHVVQLGMISLHVI